MKQESIELIILFKEEGLNSKSLLAYFDDKIKEVFSIDFHEISYSLKVKTAMRGKTLKYSKANIDKFILELPNNFDGGGFALSTYLPDFKYKSIDIKLSISYNPNIYSDNSFITITVNKDFFYADGNNNKLIDFYIKTIDFLKSIDKQITYGFIFSMINEKFPAMFAAGIGNYNLTKEEEAELQIWAERNSESDKKVWRIFWGNLITTDHLRAEGSIDKIKEIVGNDNVYIIDKNTYFFNHSNSSLLYGDENKGSKNKLLSLLNSLT